MGRGAGVDEGLDAEEDLPAGVRAAALVALDDGRLHVLHVFGSTPPPPPRADRA